MKYFTVAKFVIIGLLFGAIGLGLSASTKALPLSWTSATPTVVSSEDSSGGSDSTCRQPSRYENNIVVEGISGTKTVCASQGQHIKFGVVSSPSYTAVSFLNDQKMYVVANFGCSGAQPCTYIPSHDTLVTLRSVNGAYSGTEFTVYKNVTSRLSSAQSETFGQVYNFDYSNPDYVATSSTEKLRAYSYSISQSGRWITLPMVGHGLFRFDLENLTLLKYSNKRPAYTLGFRQNYEDAVTNDGNHIIIGGVNVTSEIYDVSNCGTEFTPSNTSQEFYNNIPNPCPGLGLSTITGITTANLKSIHDPKFSEDNGEIRLYATSMQYELKKVVLRAANYNAPPRLDYLALGDSYSSGEGDIERRPNGLKYYLPGTDVKGDYTQGIPEEKCHISMRSYPFKLIKDMELSRDQAKLVACSGAIINDVAVSANVYYTGQGDRLKKLNTQAEIDIYQKQAREQFISGRVRQNEFIERNQTEVVTLTIGGNDLKFADKLKLCITNHPLQNCSLNSEKGRAQLAKEIKSLYPKLKHTYEKIKTNSTKVYVLGYPQFVSRQFNNCGINVALSPNERVMINEAVAYANKVIKAAANDSGVKYVDIEDSLSGHSLCDFGESYVTGVSGYGISTEQQEMFHPNAKGHGAIFEKIKEGLGSQDLQDSTNCNAIIACPTGQTVGEPTVPEYFAPSLSLYDQAFKAYDMVKNTVQSTVSGGVTVVKKGINWIAEVSPMVTKPTMAVRFELNSNPVDLGTYTTNSDGSIAATLNIPANVPAGIHTLRMYAQTYSGEEVEYYQVIEVQGEDGDVDEDSIADSQDACIYIQASGTDADFDGTDDACDPEIASEPQIYRARNGNAVVSESPDYIYIERNIRASSITGISGDYDPNGDGWALVGVSQSETDGGMVANFWVDNNSVPHVSTRTEEDGCVQYTPASLAAVTPSAASALTMEATNTDTCRAEPPEEDMDGDGHPDNTQALYRARNGDTAKGEDPSKLYIERNTRAAEAQIGITDYTATDSESNGLNGDYRSTWSLLAVSQSQGTQGLFNKILTLNNNPVILAKDINNQCIALKPLSLSFVKKSTQSTRALELTTIPQGAACE